MTGIAFGCGGKSSSNGPSGTEPSVATVRCAAPSTPTVLHQGYVTGVAALGDQAYFVDGSLSRVPLGGGEAVAIVAGNAMSGLVTTADSAFFSGTHPVGDVTPEGKQSSETALYSVPLLGGTSTFIRDRFSFGHGAADATSVYVDDVLGKILEFTPPNATPIESPIGTGRSVRDLAVNSTDVFVAFDDLSNATVRGGILKIPKGGGAALVIVATAGLPDAVAADDSAVFWFEQPPVGMFGQGHIARADLDGSKVTSLGALLATALAVGANYLYVLSDTMSRIPRVGGDPEVLASGFSGAGLLRVAGADAVWIDRYTKALSDSTPSSLMSLCLQRGALQP